MSDQAQSKEDVERAKRWFRNFEIFDPNGRGQPRYPTHAQIENVAHSLAGQFADVRAEVLQKHLRRGFSTTLREAWDRLRTEIALRIPNHLKSQQFYETLNDVEGGVRNVESAEQ